MAAAQYQFEAIHPFTDGNGRADYYRLLNQVTRDEAWEDWLIYMLKAVEETARWTTSKIEAIRRLFAHTAEHVRDSLPKI